ncbi:DUF2459 domain-containing protein [Olleya sp. Bg11-27]|uniref:DUF2459 domain-containing protein n=1 Tax=Olleya sp. Bg11-27 TaxID=2058135 RepID=UPI000C309BB4|nr:DUF2459 domain-containing protein [Olleya sp. Bg11-27]AUC76299.1 DUF2459 domain-containing protein [Olleya sp. Bg11-27]
MKIAKKIIKWFLCFLLIPITYIIVSLILSSITIDRKERNTNAKKLIYLNTNGVHLDILIPIENINSLVLSGLKYNNKEKYLSFGWGDENFYINTPTWGDLTFSNAFKAMFLQSSTLMHVTRYKQKRSDWMEIKVTNSELHKLNNYLLNTFESNANGSKIILDNKGYSSTDNFYKSKGSYSCFNTCNSWVNIAFKESGLKSCLWTPFDFGLMNKYK